MVKDTLDRLATAVFRLSVIAAGVFAVAVIAWQVYIWLRPAVWTDVRFVELFRYFEFDLAIIYFPTDWHGIAKIARWILDIPLALCVPPLIVLLGWIIKEVVSGEQW